MRHTPCYLKENNWRNDFLDRRCYIAALALVGIPIIVQDDFEVFRCHAYFIHRLLLIKQSFKQLHIKIQWILEYVEYCEACSTRTSPLWKNICRISLWSEAKVTIQNANITIPCILSRSSILAYTERLRTLEYSAWMCYRYRCTESAAGLQFTVLFSLLYFSVEKVLDICRWVFTEWGTSHIVLEAWWTILNICRPDGVNPWQLIDDMTHRGAHNIREIIALTNHI